MCYIHMYVYIYIYIYIYIFFRRPQGGAAPAPLVVVVVEAAYFWAKAPLSLEAMVSDALAQSGDTTLYYILYT